MLQKILYVEDEPINAFVVKKMLEKLYNIDIAYDAEQCLGLLQTTKYDLILMDINLGDDEDGGINIMKKIGSIAEFKKIKVIAITAFAHPNDRDKFIKLGFNDYMAKPIEESNLIKVIETHIQK
jgi:CheY-like chemotaxis protein